MKLVNIALKDIVDSQNRTESFLYALSRSRSIISLTTLTCARARGAFWATAITALNTIVVACDRIADTARSHRRVFVVEVMGRDCGYLAMAAGVAAGADAVLFPESGRSRAEILDELAALVGRRAGQGYEVGNQCGDLVSLGRTRIC